jgi:hypothetical protein
MMRKIAIAARERYIEANEEDEIERQFFSPDDSAHDVTDYTCARRCGHHGGGQGNQAQIATSQSVT